MLYRCLLLKREKSETDMSGAELLDPAMLTATTLINLDSEEEGKVCFGCAGSNIYIYVYNAELNVKRLYRWIREEVYSADEADSAPLL